MAEAAVAPPPDNSAPSSSPMAAHTHTHEDTPGWRMEAVPFHSPDVEAFTAATFEEYYADAVGRPTGYHEYVFEARAGSERVAVVEGNYFNGGLVISRLLVLPPQRKTRIGSYLLSTALALGRREGLVIACVETYNFQAPDFYPKHGFHLDFSRSGFRPDSLVFHYFSRAIGPGHEPASDRDVPIPTPDAPVPFHAVDGTELTVHAVTGGAEIAQYFRSGFVEHAMATIGTHSQSTTLAYRAVLEDGTVIGAVEGKIFFGAMFIYTLIVAKEFRKHGVGSALLQSAIQHGRTERVRTIFLETFDFQAPKFYEKHGFLLDYSRKWRDDVMHYYSLRLDPIEPEPVDASPVVGAEAV